MNKKSPIGTIRGWKFPESDRINIWIQIGPEMARCIKSSFPSIKMRRHPKDVYSSTVSNIDVDLLKNVPKENKEKLTGMLISNDEMAVDYALDIIENYNKNKLAIKSDE
jgi:hypothetical protein